MTTKRNGSLSAQPFDASLSLWGCILGGLTLCVFSMLALRHYTATELEALVGAAASGLDLFLLCLLGVLARQVHLAVWNGKAPWRSRRLELLAHAVGLMVLVFGGWGLKITLSAYAVVSCSFLW